MTVPPVVILCGGKGTRLKAAVPDRPKALATINDHPFLDWLIAWLLTQDCRHIRLALGVGADQIIDHISGDRWPLARRRAEFKLDWTIEAEPLGTGGAAALALRGLPGVSAIIVNGDTLVNADLTKFCGTWSTAQTDCALLGIPVADGSRYGVLQTDTKGHLKCMLEKPAEIGAALVHAGILGVAGNARYRIETLGTGSLERDFLEKLAPGHCHVVQQSAQFLDIGTPESYSGAPVFFAHFYDVAAALSR